MQTQPGLGLGRSAGTGLDTRRGSGAPRWRGRGSARPQCWCSSRRRGMDRHASSWPRWGRRSLATEVSDDTSTLALAGGRALARAVLVAIWLRLDLAPRSTLRSLGRVRAPPSRALPNDRARDRRVDQALGARAVLRGLDLTVESGRTAWASGSGSGQDDAAAMHLRLRKLRTRAACALGAPLSPRTKHGRPTERRRVGYVAQERGPLVPSSEDVADNIAFGTPAAAAAGEAPRR